MRASLESIKAFADEEEFKLNKSNLVRTIRKLNATTKLTKINPPPKPPQSRPPYKPRLFIPREVENEVSPYNITQTLRLDWTKNDISKLKTYLRPNVNALYMHKYPDRIYVPDKEEHIGLADLSQIKVLTEREKKNKPYIYKPGYGVRIKTEEDKDYFVLPEWAKKKLDEIKDRPSGYFDLEKNDFQHQLSKFTCKEQIKTVIAMGIDKILLWLKTRDALIRLERGDKIREKMKAEGTWEDGKEYTPPPPSVTQEEKDRLMELILKQSEQLMLYDILYNNGCTNKLSKRKLKQRSRLPLICDDPDVKQEEKLESSFRYSLPYWAFDELTRVMAEKKIQTTDEEASYCLVPIYKLPKHMRKGEIEKRSVKEKKKILKYLNVMKKLRMIGITPPPKDENVEVQIGIKVTSEVSHKLEAEYTVETFKEKLLQRLNSEKKLVTHMSGVDIEEDFTGEARLQRIREKINLEEKILRMDLKLRTYDQFLKTTEEIVSTRKINPVPKFRIPPGKTDLNPKHYSALDGRAFPIPVFKKIEYLDKVKKNFITNLLKGIQDDNESKKEQQNLREIDILLKVLDEVNYFTEAFNIFLFENQEDFMMSMRTVLDLGEILLVKEAEVKQAQKIFEVVKVSLYTIGGLLKFRRMCHKLLYDLAPHHWKVDYDKEKEKLQHHADKAADDVLGHLAFFKINVIVQQPYVDKLVIFLADTLRNTGPPANYFKTPFEVDLALKQLELENMHALITTMMTLKNREELQEAKEILERKNKSDINLLKNVLDEMVERLKPKIERIKRIDKRSEKVAYHYWRTVSTNEPILCAIAHIKSLFDEFVGEELVQTENPIEMLMTVANDVIATQLQVLNIPFKERQEMYSFIKQKEKVNTDYAERIKKLKFETEKLLTGMKKSYGVSFSQQGHPPRFRSKIETFKPKVKGTNKEEPTTPISRQIMKRILNLYEPTKQDDALLDTLEAFKRIRDEKDLLRFFPGKRTQTPDTEFEDDSSSEDPKEVESLDKTLVSEDLDELESAFLKHFDEKTKSESTSAVSSIVPSITEESLPESEKSSEERRLSNEFTV